MLSSPSMILQQSRNNNNSKNQSNGSRNSPNLDRCLKTAENQRRNLFVIDEKLMHVKTQASFELPFEYKER